MRKQLEVCGDGVGGVAISTKLGRPRPRGTVGQNAKEENTNPDEAAAEFKILKKTAPPWRVEEPQGYTIKRKGDTEVRVFYKTMELTPERKEAREKCRDLIPENAI